MSEKTSLVGGTISFALVILLSFLSLDTTGGGGFFMQELTLPKMDTSVPEGDSAKAPCAEETRR